MSTNREKVNELIIKADDSAQAQNYEKAFSLFNQAKKYAQNIGWEERVGQINNMILDLQKKIARQNQEITRKERLKEKELEEQEKLENLAKAKKKLELEKEKKKKEKIQRLKEKKLRDEKLSKTAYNLLERASNEIQDKQFDLGISDFKKALEIFSNLGWKAEVDRIREFLKDAFKKKKNWEYKQEKIKKKKEQQQKLIDSRKKELKIEQINSERKEKFESMKKQRLEEESQNKETIFNEVLSRIEKIEKEIKNYEFKKKREGILSLSESIYPKAMDEYLKASHKLKEIGLMDQANHFYQGYLNYQIKQEQDQRLREIEEEKRKKKEISNEILQKQIKSSHSLEKEKQIKLDEIKRKKLQEKQLNEEKALQFLDEIKEIDDGVRNYEKNPNKFLLSSPYPDAISKYRQAYKNLIALQWKLEANRLKDGIELYSQKYQKDKQQRNFLEEQERKKQLEQEELTKKIALEKELKEQKAKLAEQKKLEQAEQEKKNALIAEQVLKEIEEIENTIKEYESNPNRLSLHPPYIKAIDAYKEGYHKLIEIGWHQQAKLFKDSIEKYEMKRIQDQNQRKILEQKQLESIKAAQEIANQAEQSKKYHNELQKKLEQTRLKEQQEQERKAQIADSILNEIEEIEKKVREYEKDPDRLSLNSPYPQIIEVLQTSIDKFKEINWKAQAERLKEGVIRYQEKLAEDTKLRELRKLKDQKSQELAREIEEKAQQSKKYYENIQQQILEQQQHERKKKIEQEKIANEVLDNIDAIEKKVKEYENNPSRYEIECPYEEIIEIMNKSISRLININWVQQAERLKDGIVRYQEKLVQDNKVRALRIKKRKEKERQEAELEKRLEQAQKKKEAEQKRLHELRKKELLEEKRKENIAQALFAKIEAIEQKVSKYESDPNRLQLPCPYLEAINIYEDSAKEFVKINWVEESNRMNESVEVYKDKLDKDKQIRQLELKKQQERKKEQEKLRHKQELAKRIEKLKEQKKQELKQQELEKAQKEQAIVKEVYSKIDQIEMQVKRYENSPDRYLLSPPYQKAIEIYTNSFEKLNSINWSDSAKHFLESIELYKDKLDEDDHYRKEIQDQQRRLEEQAQLIEKQALEAQRKLERLQKIKENQQQQEQAQKEKEQAIADQAYKSIEGIEQKIQSYENNPNKFTLQSPYQAAIETYQKAHSVIKEIGWFEQAEHIKESIDLYYQKKYNDDLERKKLKIQEFKSKKEMELLERKVALEKQMEMQKQAKLKEIEQVNLQKLNEEETLSKQAFKLIDEGNNFAQFHNYDQAIEKYQKAFKIFSKIHWTREADKLKMQINLFENEKDSYERRLREEAEQKLREKRELEELERKARITERIRQKQKEIAERKTLQEKLLKQKQQEAEIEKLIQQSQQNELDKIKNQKRELANRLKEEQLEQKIHSECEKLLDQAKILINEHQLEPALSLYRKVITKYRQIDFSPGIKLTQDTIQKVNHDHEIYLQTLQKQKQLEQQQKAESERLEKLIDQSKEIEEQNRLRKQRRELIEQKELSHKNQTQMQIINLLQDGGTFRNNKSFDEAIRVYQKALELLKTINWPLKYEQIIDLIQTTKSEQKSFQLKQEKLKSIEAKKKEEQEAFNQLIQKQDIARKEELLTKSDDTIENESIQSSDQHLQAQSYKLLELAENCINAGKNYLSLYYFHYAFLNFQKLNWEREAEITKNRLVQVYQDLDQPLLDFNDLFTNTSLSEEMEICTSLTEIMRFKRYRDYSKMYEKIEYAKIYLSLLKWKSSLQKVKNFEEKIKKMEKEQFIQEERKKQEPSYEKALEMGVNSEKYYNNHEYEKAFKLAETAINMYDYLNLSKQSEEIRKELLIWKYKAEKETSNTYLNDDDRRKARIENRKRERRARSS